MIEAYKAEIEKLIRENNKLIELNNELQDENKKLRKMVIALGSGMTIVCDGLSFKDGEFHNE